MSPLNVNAAGKRRQYGTCSLHCPKYRNERPGLLGQTGSEDLKEMLSRPKSARAAARWLVKQGVLRQFDTANQIEEEDTTDHNPFQPLEEIQ